MAARSLMERGKRPVATYIKAEFSRSGGQQHLLGHLLDYLLDPEKSLDDFERLDWCRCLIAGDATFDEFSKTVRTYDNAVTCGLVWTTDFVAYRCRTCGISPCMSLCADCFQAGNHTGHDFNMFRSQAGGACDCGDIGVMKSCGFCPRHGPEQAKRDLGVPAGLLNVAEAMMPRLMFRLVQHMRDHCTPDMLDTYNLAMQDVEQYLNFLHSLSDMGAAMRKVITRVVTNPNIYSNLTECTDSSSLYQQRSQEKYIASLESLRCPPTPEEFRGICELEEPLHHTTLLEELLFWTIKFEFPQKVVTLLLGSLPEDDYKEAFTKAFIKHYSRICIALVGCSDRTRISNRVVHISVQLLSPENLACMMVNDYNLLYIMLGSLKHMMDQVLTTASVDSAASVVDCAKGVLKDHCYWPVISDLINILSHKPVAFKFMADQRLLTFWFELLAYFQGMNQNSRELSQHVEYEPDTYYAAFSAELEICSSPMWSMIVHCQDQNTDAYPREIIRIVLLVLQNWLDAVNVGPHTKLHPYQVSFHYPLHRYFAVFVSHAVRQQGLSLPELLPPETLLQRMMLHPLQLQVAFYEVAAGLWVRNGLQIRGQAMTYVQYHFCNSMIDADLFLLQMCAARLDADYFLRTVLDRFHVADVLSFAPRAQSVHRRFLNKDQEMPMLEGTLTFLATLLTVRTQLGMTEAELTRKEMLTLLCMSDRTHSQLMDMMPEKCGLTAQAKDFEPTLEQVADYKAPNFEAGGSMQQGIYVPKGRVWEEEYDPIYVLLRAMYRRDFQASMDRYTEYVKQQGSYKGSESPWPPFRLPGPIHPAYSNLRKILHCRTMHGLLFTVLYKAVTERQTSDALIYFAIYLLEMAVTIPSPSPTYKAVPIPKTPRDKHYTEWFPTDNIFGNLLHVVNEVHVRVQDVSRASSSVATPRGNFLLQMSPNSLSGSGALISSSIGTQTAPLLAGPSSVLELPSVMSTEIEAAVHTMLQNATSQLEESMELETPEEHMARSRAVTANLDTQARTVAQEINESMLTLLLKLHSKLAGKPHSYVPETLRGTASRSADSRIGDGLFFVSKVLDKISRQSSECASFMEADYKTAFPTEEPADGSPLSDRRKEEKRRRVRERQRKLMAQFATKQKEFMEKVIGDTSDHTEESAGASIMVEKTYDCVICNQTATSTNERPFGMVTLLQSSSVLSHRIHTDEPRLLPVAGTPKQSFENCGTETEDRWKLLAQEFDTGCCLMSVNLGWQGGIHAQTCGHYVHLDCHRSYLESLRSPQHQITLDISQGEYSCPLCRQLSNSAIPILPEEGPALTLPAPTSDEEKVRLIAETMLKRKVSLDGRRSEVTQAVGAVMEHLNNVTYKEFKVTHKRPEAMHIFVCSVLRSNLELELVQSGGSPLLQPTSTLVRKISCILPLLHVLNIHSKLLTTQPYTTLWSHITGHSSSPESDSVTVYLKGVPLLLKDVTALLIQLVLDMPTTIDKAVYQCFVQALYNVLYVQALAATSSKFSEEERMAWKNKTATEDAGSVNSSMDGLLKQVISWLDAGGYYTPSSDSESLLAICQSVWSPQSVESCLQEFCLPYLRVAALLQNSWYSDTLPVMTVLDTTEEFCQLRQYLSLCSPPEGATSSPQAASSASCVQWFCRNPESLVQAWCQHFTQSVERSSSPAIIRSLLTTNPTWCLPRLQTLPQDYDKIFQHYRKQQCRRCGQPPKEPAVCLVCGQLVCFKDHCCVTSNTVMECVQHSISCGGGTGIFLVVNSSLIVVIRGPRATLWGSVYLDAHGEEDKDLKRGKPLYLSEERYKLLQQQWVTHSFDRVCKRWGFHSNRL